MAPHELFSHVSGLEVKDGSEADIVTQIRRYQKNQAARSGLRTQEDGGEDNFDYCWEQSMDQSSPTPARPIPGHTRPKPAAKVGLYLDIEQRNT